MSWHNLEQKFRKSLEGEVRFDNGSRAIYATDSSNYRQVPIGVIVPKTIEDVIQTISICREFSAPVLMRGGGTSLAGQCCNVAVVLDTSKYLNKITSIDIPNRMASVQPGVILDSLRNAVASHGLTFGPDPATHNRCTLGGMIGNNACGVHSVYAGKTVDNVEELEVLTYDGLRFKAGKTPENELRSIIGAGGRQGEIYKRLRDLRDRYADLVRTRYPKIPRRVSGYNLDQLLPENGFHVGRALVGTEGSCVTILEAKLKLVHSPKERTLVVLSYKDVYEAGDDVGPILDFKPIGLEGLDEFFVRNMKKRNLHLPEIAMLPEGNGWLLVEFGAETKAESEARAQSAIAGLKKTGRYLGAKIFTDSTEQKLVWSVRESTFGASVFVPGERDTYAGFEDSAVEPQKLGAYMRDLRKLYDQYDYYAVTYGHFGDGCIHTRISFDLHSADGVKKYRDFLEEAADLVLKYGGSFSGEHGDGQNWGELLPKMFGPELMEAFQEFKNIWDPQNRMNPGKKINTYRADENLRLYEFQPISSPKLHFKFQEDGGNFGRTSLRCIGIGKCRKEDEGAMCPSYMATREEEHSTRGRARILFEMMKGEVIKDGWTDPHVKSSLDLCLSCKACKTECPVGVDMASYKAEFLSHYYEHKPRPLTAYLFGMIYQWARFAAKMPAVANFMTQAPGLREAAKWIAGIAPERNLPRFAGESFQSWFRRRAKSLNKKSKVMIWPDTFNNYFYPEVPKDAVEVLEALGYEVILPSGSVCCGRPLYDFGMLDQASALLKNVMTVLADTVEQKIPIVGLEPSCVSVFRDELMNLFPEDPRVLALSQNVFLFSEFLEKHAAQLPKLSGRAVVHGHCHQKALMGMGSEQKVLSALGVQAEFLDSGCCGMAGAFGFEKAHYDISINLADRVLIPAVNKAPEGTWVMTNGFSCKEQLKHRSQKPPLHLAEVVKMAFLEKNRACLSSRRMGG